MPEPGRSEARHHQVTGFVCGRWFRKRLLDECRALPLPEAGDAAVVRDVQLGHDLGGLADRLGVCRAIRVVLATALAPDPLDR